MLLNANIFTLMLRCRLPDESNATVSQGLMFSLLFT